MDKLGKPKFPDGLKKILAPVTKTIEDVFEDITKTETEN